MSRTIRALLSALALLAFCAPLAYAGATPSDDDDGGPPLVWGKSARDVSDTGATLRAGIDPNSDDDWWWAGQTTYRFEIGPTTAYGYSTPNGTLQPWQDWTTVYAPVSGLQPGTTYSYRAVASNAAGATYGPSMTFKTSGKAAAATSAPKGPKSPKGPDVEAEPELGRSVAAQAAAGTVRVREQGSTEFHPLADAEEIPVNSTFDTSDGTVVLEAARGNGKTYSGSFHGGTFQVRQSHHGKGTTVIALRGGDFSACDGSVHSRAARSGKSVKRKLWGKDHGGRFKTSGRGSVATVRGTKWYTAESCNGTLTKVTKGAVLVRERGTGRQRLLHKGESFFAHLRH